MVGLNGRFWLYFLVTYALAMATTAQGVFGAALAGGNAKLAMQISPLIFAPQMLFAGFFVSPDLIPSWLRWAQKIYTMTYAVRVLVVEEFEMCSENNKELEKCDELLMSTHSDPSEVWWYWLAMVAIFIIFRFLALGILQRSAMKFY